jgi:hypothetical protein
MPAENPAPESDPLVAAELCRGALRLLAERGDSGLAEVRLGNGRRADILALDGGGRITIVEVKSSLADYRADAKWPEYLDYCDRFYFAVGPAFPADVLPPEHGLILADRHGAAILRESAALPAVPPARRRSVTLSVALQAAERLRRRDDPAL